MQPAVGNKRIYYLRVMFDVFDADGAPLPHFRRVVSIVAVRKEIYMSCSGSHGTSMRILVLGKLNQLGIYC